MEDRCLIMEGVWVVENHIIVLARQHYIEKGWCCSPLTSCLETVKLQTAKSGAALYGYCHRLCRGRLLLLLLLLLLCPQPEHRDRRRRRGLGRDRERRSCCTWRCLTQKRSHSHLILEILSLPMFWSRINIGRELPQSLFSLAHHCPVRYKRCVNRESQRQSRRYKHTRVFSFTVIHDSRDDAGGGGERREREAERREERERGEREGERGESYKTSNNIGNYNVGVRSRLLLLLNA